ncbi:MAG: murein biosynthesis integral membrane protein MurJ [Hyphomicrobiales bacterium]|nr:murein biosynthesis integral membrane protein MurJ [Hyphomicrobiales bacterium]
MKILGDVLGVGAATLASRILGFLRDTLVATVLGAGPVADAFVVAQRLPNMFRRLFAEGAFAAAFVPAYMRLRADAGEAAALRFAGAAASVLLAVLAALTVAVWLWAEPVVGLVAPGYRLDPEKLALAAELTRWAFPYLTAVTLVALLGGVLAADRRFLAAAVAPTLLNLLLIVVLVGLLLTSRGDVFAGRALAVTVALAGLAQLVFVGLAARRAGLAPRLARPTASPAMKGFFRALGPGLVAGGFVEINVVVATMIASSEPGAVSWLYYADRLYQLPLGLVGIAIGQVLLPEIADARDRPADEIRAMQNRALEFALALALPAAVGLVLLADPIVVALFRRGVFAASDASASATALATMALALPAAVTIRVFSAAYFGRGDTRTPMRHGVVAVAVNIALALALRPVLGWIAVAWAGALATWLNAVLLGAGLVRRGDWRLDADARRRLPRLVLAALGAGLVLLVCGRLGLDRLAAAEASALRLLGVAALVLVALLAQAGLLVALGVVERADLARLLARRRSGRAEPACEPPRDAA